MIQIIEKGDDLLRIADARRERDVFITSLYGEKYLNDERKRLRISAFGFPPEARDEGLATAYSLQNKNPDEHLIFVGNKPDRELIAIMWREFPVAQLISLLITQRIPFGIHPTIHAAEVTPNESPRFEGGLLFQGKICIYPEKMTKKILTPDQFRNLPHLLATYQNAINGSDYAWNGHEPLIFHYGPRLETIFNASAISHQETFTNRER